MKISAFSLKKLRFSVILSCVVVPGFVWAQIPPPFLAEQQQQEQRQLERDRLVREQNERNVSERLAPVAAPSILPIPQNETPCFRIDSLRLIGEESEFFQNIISDLGAPDGSDTPIGRCIGTNGVNVILGRAQAKLIAGGWITSRVLVGAQDLSTGTLTLTFVPGRISAIRMSEDSSVQLLGNGAFFATAIPARVGDVLNLRAIEQGLENLKSAPTAEADIKIQPSVAKDARAGDSELLVKYIQARKVRLGTTLDDSGIRSTGLYQGGVTLSVDNALGLNDLLYINASHNIDSDLFNSADHATKAQSLGYSVPFGYWSVGVTASKSNYFQTIAGYQQSYVYSGNSNNLETKLSRLLYRDQNRKTTASIRAFRQESRSYVDDTEVGVQHRVTGGWAADFSDKEYLGSATLDSSVGYTHGTGAFGALHAPEELFGEGTSRFRFYTSSISLNAPFKLNLVDTSQNFKYTGVIRGQWAETTLSSQNRIVIGGRYSVRGFDGQQTLAGDAGLVVRNDLGWILPGGGGAEVYTGVDYGKVSGRSTAILTGTHLAGAVVGVRGAMKNVGYDVFVGTPISKPESFRTAGKTLNFNLTANF